MYRVIHRFVMLASVAVLAAGSTNCSRSGDSESSSSILGPSEAARGGNGRKPSGGGGTGTLTYRMVNDQNGNGLPNWSDSVTFDISTSATSEPFVDLACYQNGALVYGATGGFFDSYRFPGTRVMTLTSPSWQGGAADCTAKLYYLSGTRNVELGSTSFRAYE
jgi:hypothetical protein